MLSPGFLKVILFRKQRQCACFTEEDTIISTAVFNIHSPAAVVCRRRPTAGRWIWHPASSHWQQSIFSACKDETRSSRPDIVRPSHQHRHPPKRKKRNSTLSSAGPFPPVFADCFVDPIRKSRRQTSSCPATHRQWCAASRTNWMATRSAIRQNQANTSIHPSIDQSIDRPKPNVTVDLRKPTEEEAASTTQTPESVFSERSPGGRVGNPARNR